MGEPPEACGCGAWARWVCVTSNGVVVGPPLQAWEHGRVDE